MKIRFLDVGCGDSIHIRFLGNDNHYHNIFIDGGVEYSNIYDETLRKEIIQIVEKRELIDLWIVTHIDNDHIGGILRLINDAELFGKVNLAKTKIWFNYSNLDYDTGIRFNNQKSVKQGLTLRNFLAQNSILVEFVTDGMEPVDFYGAKLSILSPDKSKLNKLLVQWQTEEIKIMSRQIVEKKGSRENDYKIPIVNFDLANFKEDNSMENESSIAFILSYNDKHFIFLADSHPSQIVKSLKEMGYGKNEKRLIAEYMQLSHHGSKLNTSDELLQLIDCSNYIVSADGLNTKNLPNKITFARVIKNNPNTELNFYITQKNNSTSSIFTVDEPMEGINVFFPSTDSNALEFEL